MLQRIHIRNYAIIEKLTIEFNAGLNIITGETGAGKSILMGALGLVLGDRADSNVLFSAQEKCVVEAVFQPADAGMLSKLLLANDLDTDDQLVVRREISVAGKSRSFVNDTPVTLQVLRQFATQMVDLHRQFDTLDVGEDDFQRNVLDALGGNQELVPKYRQHYAAYNKAKQQYTAALQEQENATKELDYYRFLFTELEEANFSDNEIEEAELAYDVLSNAEAVKQVLGNAAEAMHGGETPVVQQLKMVLQQLQQLKAQPAALPSLIERLQAAHIELKDIGDEIASMADNVHMDEERLQHLSERINLGNRLMKKHNVQTTAALLSIQQDLEQKLQNVLHLDERIEQLQQTMRECLQQTVAVGEAISTARKKCIPAFEKNIQALLTQVGMPNARLQVQCKPLDAPAAHGMDDICFLFDANKSGRFEPLEKVASGGELSRLMLSIKSLVAGSLQMPTMIFDEIDSGISGEAARQVGLIMKKLVQKHQLIAITHQPQIAAKADAHFFVYKAEAAGSIKTGIRLLTEEESVKAIAHMLSGNQQTEASLKIAREMMEG